MCIISFYQQQNHNFKNDTLKTQPIIKLCCNIFHQNSFCLHVTNKDLYITYNIDKRITILLNFILFSLYTLYFTYWDSFNSISFQLNTCLHTFYMQGCIETSVAFCILSSWIIFCLIITIITSFISFYLHHFVSGFFAFISWLKWLLDCVTIWPCIYIHVLYSNKLFSIINCL